jgi:hypothetical protein
MILLVSYETLGAVGANFSLLATTVASQILCYWRIVSRLTNLWFNDFWSQTLSRGLMPALAAAPVCVGTRYAGSPNSWPELLICTIFGGAVYLFVLLSHCLDASMRVKSVICGYFWQYASNETEIAI